MRSQRTTTKGPSKRTTDEESLPGQAARDAQAQSELATLKSRILELEARDRARVNEIAYLRVALHNCRQDAASSGPDPWPPPRSRNRRSGTACG
jgi:hypothetical protein